jgi:hypothetical protein
MTGRCPGDVGCEVSLGAEKGVALGQDLTDAGTQSLPGRCATARRQISQRVTGSWVTVTERWLEATLLICLSESRAQ